jgi:1-acyl-sn-glycerol-3-phosphate acyltransferase
VQVILHRFTCFWASVYTWINPFWPVKVTGATGLHHRKT